MFATRKQLGENVIIFVNIWLNCPGALKMALTNSWWEIFRILRSKSHENMENFEKFFYIIDWIKVNFYCEVRAKTK